MDGSGGIVLEKEEKDVLHQEKEVMEVTEEASEERIKNERLQEKEGPQEHRAASGASSQAVTPSYTGDSLPESVPGKISKACALKQEGNEFFKNGRWKKAMRKYHYALMYVNGVISRVDSIPGLEKMRKVKATPEEEKIANDLISTLLNNLAACLLKVGEWEKVVMHTTKVLDNCPGNTKALFRRGIAYMNLSKFEEAENDLKEAEKMDPDDVGIKKQLLTLQQKMRDYEKQERKLYASMFQTR